MKNDRESEFRDLHFKAAEAIGYLAQAAKYWAEEKSDKIQTKIESHRETLIAYLNAVNKLITRTQRQEG